MPGQFADVGTGATLVCGTTGFTALIHIENVRWDGMSRNSFPTSHLGTPAPAAGRVGNATFIPGRIVDPGTLTMDVQHNPQVRPPLHADPETITVTFPKASADATAAYWSCTGFFVGVSSMNIPFDDKMMSTIVLKMTGEINMVLAA